MKAKVCLVGEPAVGKTSLIRRFVLNEFDDRYISTLGSKVSMKHVLLDAPDGDGTVQVDLTIWDIMGQRDFRVLLKETYFLGAQGVLAVCDVTRRSTLSELEGWIDLARAKAGDVPFVFLGNKADLASSVAIADEDLATVAKGCRAPHMSTSAKTGLNVERALQELARAILKVRTPLPA